MFSFVKKFFSSVAQQCTPKEKKCITETDLLNEYFKISNNNLVLPKKVINSKLFNLFNYLNEKYHGGFVELENEKGEAPDLSVLLFDENKFVMFVMDIDDDGKSAEEEKDIYSPVNDTMQEILKFVNRETKRRFVIKQMELDEQLTIDYDKEIKRLNLELNCLEDQTDIAKKKKEIDYTISRKMMENIWSNMVCSISSISSNETLRVKMLNNLVKNLNLHEQQDFWNNFVIEKIRVCSKEANR